MNGGEEKDEVWRLLPDRFTDVYSQLADLALPRMAVRGGSGIGRSQVKGHQSRMSSGGKNVVMAAGAAHTHSPVSRDVIGSEAAFAFKQSVDRKIRKLAREVAVWLDRGAGSGAVRRRCSGRCKQWSEPDWLYCPACGSPTIDMG